MKPNIPPVPRSSVGSDRAQFDSATKETLELITGRRGSEIEALPLTATLTDVIRKVNEIIARLQ
jgi:hypothetical protein